MNSVVDDGRVKATLAAKSRGYEEIIPNLVVVLSAPAMGVKPDESQSSDLLDREWYGIVEIKFSKISLTFARRLSIV